MKNNKIKKNLQKSYPKIHLLLCYFLEIHLFHCNNDDHCAATFWKWYLLSGTINRFTARKRCENSKQLKESNLGLHKTFIGISLIFFIIILANFCKKWNFSALFSTQCHSTANHRERHLELKLVNDGQFLTGSRHEQFCWRSFSYFEN